MRLIDADKLKQHYSWWGGLIETSDNINFLLPYAVKSTGSEGASAERVRNFRDKKALQSNADVTQVKRIGNVEKEIEKEKEIEIDNMLKKAFKRIPK